MKKGYIFITILVLTAFILTVAGCTTAQTLTITQTSTVTQTLPGTTVSTTVTVTQQPTGTTPATMTAAALALKGEDGYSTNCDVDYCHDGWTEPTGNGTGGKAYFATLNLGKFSTAQGFFSFIKYYMPNSSPGSLSDETLLEITAFMLTDLGKVSPDALFGLANLSTFSLS